ncbi:MAG: GlcG protein [Candidatus Rokuibacteriota bacterium]|nr:MAG: GlcG protein [Candidatus Rokubacteria bacterium]PYM67018.1 MAG: GlcG protein [Candidatus Rokubacteria bacterium]PYN69803.1 MAG: GlcG protein [Candidatus Rokubacteria bacterium]
MTGLSLQQATTIVESALRKARATSCAPLAVAVLDAGGHLKAFAREDGAGIVRPQIAIAKAWGALGMGVGTRALARRIAEQPQLVPFFGALNAMSEGRVVPVPGGVLVKDAGGAVIGAVGVSGDVSDKDEACALAGIEATRLVADTG